MRRIYLFFLLIGIVLLGFSGKTKAQIDEYDYISPRPGAKYVSSETSIILHPHGHELVDIAHFEQIKIIGQSSGIHIFDVHLAANGKRVILDPLEPFLPGETVEVSSGTSSLSFSFTVSTKIEETAVIPWAQEPANFISQQANAVFDNEPRKTLPADFPAMVVTTPAAGTSEDFLFITNFTWGDFSNSHPYLMILDNEGEPVFVRKMPDGQMVADFKAHENGLLTYFDNAASHFVVLDDTYSQVDTFAAGNGYETDVHELLLTDDGGAILMIYDPQPVDMSQVIPDGDPNATVIGLVIQELDAQKNVIFEWRSWDHFEITDATVDITGPNVDYSHGNSIEVDTDGHYIISSRHMDEVTKISRQTGEIIWRLGGKNNDFTFDSNDDKFYRQHDARRLANGNLLLFDNGQPGIRPVSRAVEYELDEINMTAAVVSEFRNSPDTFSVAMGSARRLENGNTIVGWGSGYPAITEFRADGTKAFELLLDAPLVSYRAFRLPWQGNPIERPFLVSDYDGETITLTYGWNGATDIASYKVYGGPEPNPTTLLTTETRQGYETSTVITNTENLHYFRIMPVDKDGHDTEYSNETVVGAYKNYLPLLSNENSSTPVPLAASKPFGYAWNGNDTQHVVYQAEDQRIHELWYKSGNNWTHNGVGWQTNAPRMVGNPSSYVRETQQTQHTVYRDDVGNIHELWYRADLGWSHNNLSQKVGGVPAADDPIGYVWEENGTQHVIYRGVDNQIHELWKSQTTDWTHKNLSVETAAPLVMGRPSAYVWAENDSQHIVYLGQDYQIHELYFIQGAGWQHNDIGTKTAATRAIGNPFGYVWHGDSTQHVIYRGMDGRIHELWSGGSGWTHKNVTVQMRVTPAAGDPVGYAWDETDGQHIFYRGTDGQVHELRYTHDSGWQYHAIGTAANAPQAASDVSAYVWHRDGSQHVVYADENGHVHELWAAADNNWTHKEISMLKD